MSDLPRLLEGNHRFTAHFADGELPIRPRLSTIVLTCLDARVDPAHLFDLQPGDALVIRTPAAVHGRLRWQTRLRLGVAQRLVLLPTCLLYLGWWI